MEGVIALLGVKSGASNPAWIATLALLARDDGGPSRNGFRGAACTTGGSLP